MKWHTLVVNCFQILYIRSLNTIVAIIRVVPALLWIAFRFCIFVLWTQFVEIKSPARAVVNCFQILYIRSLNTIIYFLSCIVSRLWIAFRFCIFVLWTQYPSWLANVPTSCELLSDFVYSFFEHNAYGEAFTSGKVVNCFQILYIRSLNTILPTLMISYTMLWIAFRFCIFVLWTQFLRIFL